MLSKWCLALLVCTSSIITAWGYNRDPDYRKARIKGARARIVLKIADDEDVPVPGTDVHVLMGMNYRLNSYDIDGLTDTNGVFVIEGKTTGNEIEMTVKKDGYYQTSKKLSFIEMGREQEVKDGKWQPWGMEIRLPLRRIRNQADMIHAWESFLVPATNAWIGFDMECKDWVYPPVHKGKRGDFEVFLTWDGKVTAYSNMLKLNVRFPEKDSGFYLADFVKDSQFGGVYSADTNRVWMKEFDYRVFNRGRVECSGIEVGKQIIMRTRCVHDLDGNLLGANYSTLTWFMIHGSFDGKVEMPMAYLFNPTLNDTNLEPKR